MQSTRKWLNDCQECHCLFGGTVMAYGMNDCVCVCFYTSPTQALKDFPLPQHFTSSYSTSPVVYTRREQKRIESSIFPCSGTCFRERALSGSWYQPNKLLPVCFSLGVPFSILSLRQHLHAYPVSTANTWHKQLKEGLVWAHSWRMQSITWENMVAGSWDS